MSERCVITIDVEARSDNYREEDWVKNIWSYMIPFFTKRHGVRKGEISLEDGSVRITWEYASIWDEASAVLPHSFKCPINFEGCTKNCGNYGCGN